MTGRWGGQGSLQPTRWQEEVARSEQTSRDRRTGHTPKRSFLGS